MGAWGGGTIHICTHIYIYVYIYICNNIKSKLCNGGFGLFCRASGSVLPVRHLYYNSTTIPQLPAPPYALQYAPQSALAPLQLCPPSTTFIYTTINSTKIPQLPAPQYAPPYALQSALTPRPLHICTTIHNENPSASRAAVVRAAVRSRTPLALSSQHYINLCYYNSTLTKIPQLPAPQYVLPYAPQPALAPLPALQYYICTANNNNEIPSASRATVRAAVRAAVRSRAPPALSSQWLLQLYYNSTSSVLPVLHLHYNSTKIPQLPAPPYAPPCAPQSALAPLRLCPPSTTL